MHKTILHDRIHGAGTSANGRASLKYVPLDKRERSMSISEDEEDEPQSGEKDKGISKTCARESSAFEHNRSDCDTPEETSDSDGDTAESEDESNQEYHRSYATKHSGTSSKPEGSTSAREHSRPDDPDMPSDSGETQSVRSSTPGRSDLQHTASGRDPFRIVTFLPSGEQYPDSEEEAPITPKRKRTNKNIAPEQGPVPGSPRQKREREDGPASVRKIKKYKCELCVDFYTGSKHDLVRHLESKQHKAPSHICPVPLCRKAFTREDSLKRHMKTVHK